MAKILFFEVHDWEKEYLEKNLGDSCHELQFYYGKIDAVKTEELKDTEALCIFIYSKITRELLEKMPNLKFITTRSTGFDHIDLDACKERNIQVANVPTYGENTVAEHTFALILNLSRNVHKSYVRTIQNDFRTTDLQGFDLKGRTLGVIGAGHIGMHVVKIAKGFGMHVLAYDRHPKQFIADILHFRYCSLNKLYANSDIITIHLALNDKTKHTIDAKVIQRMKDGVIIVNTARGGLIDSAALYKGLVSGKIGGVGLDVLEDEEHVLQEAQHPRSKHRERWKALHDKLKILRMPNVVFTPHNAFNSKEALERILETTVQNLKLSNLSCKEGINLVRNT